MGNQPGNQPAIRCFAAFFCWTADVLIKDQVTRMLFRKNIVSTRTLLQLAVASAFFVGGVGAAVAANNGVAPLLVPYTVNVIAGTPTVTPPATTPVAGYFGEGIKATPYGTSATSGATLNGPYSMAVDSVGNVYITDKGNNIIREVNAQTGLITTIAGVIPKGCSGVSCSLKTTGCDDGVPAAGAKIASGVQGIAVDSYGNVFFDDTGTSTVSVIYRGGSQVAAFIALEDPAGVAKSGGSAQVGYVYHVAGTVDLTSCAATTGNTDATLAFEDSSNPPTNPGGTLHGPGVLSLDSAGNIYISDNSNATVRVINTQATPQTFFQYTVPPGYIQSITNCSAALTVPCPTATTTASANTGINGPINAIVFNTQYKFGGADAYGNVYQLDGTGSGTGQPGIYGNVGYAGGAPLTNLLTAEAPMLASYYGPGNTSLTLATGGAPAELPLTYGNGYITLGNPLLTSPSLPNEIPDIYATASNGWLDVRPASLRMDPFGSFYFIDTHYPELTRIDQYTSLSTLIMWWKGGRPYPLGPATGINNSNPSFTNPYYCVIGNTATPATAWTQGPQTYDVFGDGCPAAVAAMGVSISSGPDMTFDGLGNLYYPDSPNQLMRELPLGNTFPATPVGTPVVQAIQVHFNSSNPPVITGTQVAAAADPDTYTTTSFGTAPGITDFAVNTTTPEFPFGSLISTGFTAATYTTTTANFAMWAGLPTCTQLGVFPAAVSPTNTDWDCLVYVTFNPQGPGSRKSQLVITTANGSIYNFPLSGVGVGGQLAIDGGAATPVPVAGLGKAAGIATNGAGTLYIADATNNRIVVRMADGTQSNLAISGVSPSTLNGPMGVAVDAANNVYISDTGNNRVLKVDPITNVAKVLGNYVWIPGNASTAPPQYKFNAPQGLAVDSWNNVYVADTGNKVVVEIPSNPALGGAVPLLAYPGAPQFVNPVAVAIDSQNNIYVADTQNSTGQIVELPPGGGDLVTVPTSQFSKLRGGSLVTPTGVAVDAAGNLYVSDPGADNGPQVIEFPGGSGPGSASFPLNFKGLNSPAGIALDPSGNLYVADFGNKQILFDNRQNPVIDFGTVPQFQTTVATAALTITNIGSQAVPLVSPFTSVTSTNPSGNTAFTITNNTCTTTAFAGPLSGGLSCSVTASFNPTSNGAQGQNLTVNGGPGTIQLTANGEQPLANVVLSASYSSGSTPTAGATATITATVTQPHVGGDTPAGSVTFNYTIQGDGTSGSQTVPLAGSGGTATASFALPAFLQGRRYTINATYNSTDPLSSGSSATPLVLYVPGLPVTVIANSVSFTYGSAVPAITGTVTGITDPAVTYKFTSAASPATPVGTYPITVVFSGGTYLNYGFPPAVTSTGAAAIVTENPASLTYSIPAFTAQYGALPLSYGADAKITGAVNSDKFSASFTPPDSSVLDVGTYSVTPTVTGAHVADYKVTASPATLTVTQAPAGITVSGAQTSVLNTTAGMASATFQIAVGTLVTPQGKGIPTGTVTVSDSFTPITPGAPGTIAAVQQPDIVVPLVAGFATFTPTGLVTGVTINNTPVTGIAAGTHHYSFAYSGDKDFQCSVFGAAATSKCPTTSATSTNLLVDNPDFTVSSTTGVVIVLPGVVPSGNGLPPAANQSTAAPETAIINIGAVLGFAGQVSVSCATQNPTYVFCSMTPPVACLGTCTAANGTTSTVTNTASVLSVWTPTNLPLGFFGKSQPPSFSKSKTVLAFLPFGVLAFCVRRRRRLAKMLWMLIAVAAITAGVEGCGGNQVAFYTPVPTGLQNVTITGTFTGASGIPSETRSFVVPISIN